MLNLRLQYTLMTHVIFDFVDDEQSSFPFFILQKALVRARRNAHIKDSARYQTVIE